MSENTFSHATSVAKVARSENLKLKAEKGKAFPRLAINDYLLAVDDVDAGFGYFVYTTACEVVDYL